MEVSTLPGTGKENKRGAWKSIVSVSADIRSLNPGIHE
jgi:hypothetical protein